MTATNEKIWLSLAGLNGFMAILMGTIAAHGIADAHAAHLVEKASQYQLIHAGVLLTLANRPGRGFQVVRGLLQFAIILFCGSLYLKGLSGWSDAAMLAPMGGIGFMLGWLVLVFVKARK